jgi:predicted dehydrogenase
VAERLRDRVDGSDLAFMAGYQRHLSPAYVAVRERYADGDHEPSHVVGDLTQDWTHHFESGADWRTDPEVGGRGHLFSVGTHVVESVLWATGLTPTAVSAEMEFADSAVAPVTREHVHFWDADGALYVDAEDWGDQRLTMVEAGSTERRHAAGEGTRRDKFAAFVDAVETGEDPPATAGDVYRVTALLDAAYESARTGERVAVRLK